MKEHPCQKCKHYVPRPGWRKWLCDRFQAPLQKDPCKNFAWRTDERTILTCPSCGDERDVSKQYALSDKARFALCPSCGAAQAAQRIRAGESPRYERRPAAEETQNIVESGGCRIYPAGTASKGCRCEEYIKDVCPRADECLDQVVKLGWFGWERIIE